MRTDYILTDKPVILALFDYDEYTASTRSLRVNPDDAGFLIAKNQEELEEILRNLNNIDCSSFNEKVNEYYGTYESGKATVGVCDVIMKWLE